MPSKVGQERGINGMTERQTRQNDTYEIKAPRTETNEDDFSISENPKLRERFSRKVKVGAGVLASLTLAAGITAGYLSNNASAKGPAHLDRPTQSAPANPGDHDPTSAASTAEASPKTYTAETMPFMTVDGGKVIGEQAYAQEAVVPYDDSKINGQNTNPNQYGEEVVIPGMFGNLLNAAKYSYDPTLYGALGTGTTLSSSEYEKVALGPGLVDQAYADSVKTWFENIAVSTRNHPITSYKIYPHVSMSGTNELTGSGWAYETASRIDITTDKGTTSYFVRAEIVDDTTSEGHNWVFHNIIPDTLQDARNNPSYDQSMIPTN